MQFELYRQRLSPKDKVIYDNLRDGIVAFQRSIGTPPIDTEDFVGVTNAVSMDHPELFYVREFRYMAGGTASAVISPAYTHSATAVKELMRIAKQKIAPILNRMPALNEYEKELAVHDFLCQEVRYSAERGADAHNIVGALVHGESVCEGTAKAAKFIFDQAGIESCIVQGKLKTNTPLEGDLHAWNIVKINGYYYHLDITKDSTIKKKAARYDYFNLTDDEITRAYTITGRPDVRCERNELNYYNVNGLVMNKQENLINMLNAGIKKGKRSFVFKLPNVNSRKNAIEKVTKIIEDVWRKNRLPFFEVGYDEYQLVFEVNFG